MARFQQELSRGLGDFWQRQVEAELERIKAGLDGGEIAIDEAGVARNCIGRALMDDLLEKLLLVTDKADSTATRTAQEAEVRADLESYQASKRHPAPRSWARYGPRLARAPRWWMSSRARRFSSDPPSKIPNVWGFAANKKAPSQVARWCKPARGHFCCHIRRFPTHRWGLAAQM